MWHQSRPHENSGLLLLPVAGLLGLALAVAFVLSSARLYMWWGGSSAPARFLVPIAPLLAPALALAMAKARGPPSEQAVTVKSANCAIWNSFVWADTEVGVII